MEERKFKIGDDVIFKSFTELGSSYQFGGEDMGGVIGKVSELGKWGKGYGENTVRVKFTSSKNNQLVYTMLESELKEYLPSDLNMSIKGKKKSLNFGY